MQRLRTMRRMMAWSVSWASSMTQFAVCARAKMSWRMAAMRSSSGEL